MALRLRAAGGVLALAGLGCAAGVPVETIVDPSFPFPAVEAVAVLPLFEWSLGARSADSLTACVSEAFSQTLPHGRVIPAGEAGQLIGRSGLAYDWALFLHDWEAGAEVHRAAAMRVADLLGVDLLLVLDLPEVIRHDGTGSYGLASTVVVVRLRAFSGATGVLAWHGSAGIDLVASRLDPRRAPPVMDAAVPVLHAILGELPRLGSGG